MHCFQILVNFKLCLDVHDLYSLVAKSGELKQLSNLCEQQIKKTPEWLTPYFYLGLASADMGDKVKAIANLEYVISNSPGDPNYAQAIEILQKVKSQ